MDGLFLSDLNDYMMGYEGLYIELHCSLVCFWAFLWCFWVRDVCHDLGRGLIR